MKHSPGRKERRNNLYRKSYDNEKKRSIQPGHGKPNTVHAMGVMHPTVQVVTKPPINRLTQYEAEIRQAADTRNYEVESAKDKGQIEQAEIKFNRAKKDIHQKYYGAS